MVRPDLSPPSSSRGYSGLPAGSIDPARTRVSFIPTDGTPELLLLDKGEPVPFSEDRASDILALEDLEVQVDLGAQPIQGENGTARYWTCDFSHVRLDFYTPSLSLCACGSALTTLRSLCRST